jgi:hypothetical protein
MPDSHDPNNPPPAEAARKARPLSMHEDVPTWCDTCSCEPEPRWKDLEEELQPAPPARPARGNQ